MKKVNELTRIRNECQRMARIDTNIFFRVISLSEPQKWLLLWRRRDCFSKTSGRIRN